MSDFLTRLYERATGQGVILSPQPVYRFAASPDAPPAAEPLPIAPPEPATTSPVTGSRGPGVRPVQVRDEPADRTEALVASEPPVRSLQARRQTIPAESVTTGSSVAEIGGNRPAGGRDPADLPREQLVVPHDHPHAAKDAGSVRRPAEHIPQVAVRRNGDPLPAGHGHVGDAVSARGMVLSGDGPRGLSPVPEPRRAGSITDEPESGLHADGGSRPATPPSAPPIEVVIGRIEVRSGQVGPAPMPQQRHALPPLAERLRGRKRR